MDAYYSTKLGNLYPNNKIENLSQINATLYQSIRKYSISQGKSFDEYVKSIGFEGNNKDTLKKTLKEHLLEKYPNKIILKLSIEFPALYQKAWQEAFKQKKSVNDYLRELGFETKQSNLDLISELNLGYPNHIVEGMCQSDPILYQHIRNAALNNNQTIKEFLNELGFEYRAQRGKNPTVDIAAIRKMCEKFNFTPAQLASYIGVSRQHISNLLKNGKQNDDPLWNDTLSEQDLIQLHDLINNNIYTIQSSGIFIIRRNVENCNEFVIFIKDEIEIKCVFNLSSDLIQRLKDNRYHELDEIDVYLMSQIEPKYLLGKEFGRGKDVIANRKIYNRVNKLGVSIDEYFKILGYDGYISSKDYDDEYFKNLLQNYVNDDSLLDLPINTNDYHNLSNYASRNGITLNNLLDYYGYSKEKRVFRWGNGNDELIENLQLFVLGGNKVYLPSEDKLHQQLLVYARKKGLSLNEFLLSLGYERIYEKKSTVEFENFYYGDEDHGNKEVLLSEIKKIQGKLHKTAHPGLKRKRSAILAKKLKKLYDYRCQMCEVNNGIPLIEKQDGNYYVEIHHIHSIAGMDVTSEEENTIDTYLNTIIVCPFHHKVLHYHHGGFDEFFEDENGLYFVSKKETILRVHNNRHLMAENH